MREIFAFQSQLTMDELKNNYTFICHPLLADNNDIKSKSRCCPFNLWKL
jgi:hypothetical protein